MFASSTMASSRLPAAPESVSAIPHRIAKQITWSMLPCVRASKGLRGTMSTSTSASGRRRAR
jgi:hypothetical protein